MSRTTLRYRPGGSRPERALLDRARRGDGEALTALYRAHGDTVYRTALRLMGSVNDAEDVLQDVFVGLPEALRTYEGRGSLDAWLGRVAARTALTKLRWRRRKAEVALEAAPQAAPTSSPVVRLTLETALSRLPASLRVVFVLREVEGYHHAEIAEMLGIGVGASKVRLHRARRALQRFLSQCG